MEAGGSLDDDDLEADVLSLSELAVEDLGLVDPVTLDTDFLAAAALVCCFALDCTVCITDTDLVCDDDALAEDAV